MVEVRFCLWVRTRILFGRRVSRAGACAVAAYLKVRNGYHQSRQTLGINSVSGKPICIEVSKAGRKARVANDHIDLSII